MVVTAPALIKSFVSVVAEEPHKVHYYYGRLLLEYNKNRSSELFSEADYPGLYFASHHIASKARSAVLRDRYLSQWGFHVALLIKRQIAPELKKGTSLTDKRFLEILRRIDQEFDRAYSNAAGILRKLKLDPNQNRFSEVTSNLTAEMGRQMPKASSKPPVSVPPSAPARAEPALSDGQYVGVIYEADPRARRISLRYGPYIIEGSAANDDALGQPLGTRVPFTVRKGVISVSSPQLS